MPSSVCYKQIGHLLVTGGRIVHGVLSNRGTVVYICIYVYIYIYVQAYANNSVLVGALN